jgi:hypothetical protein
LDKGLQKTTVEDVEYKRKEKGIKAKTTRFDRKGCGKGKQDYRRVSFTVTHCCVQ